MIREALVQLAADALQTLLTGPDADTKLLGNFYVARPAQDGPLEQQPFLRGQRFPGGGQDAGRAGGNGVGRRLGLHRDILFKGEKAAEIPLPRPQEFPDFISQYADEIGFSCRRRISGFFRAV